MQSKDGVARQESILSEDKGPDATQAEQQGKNPDFIS